MKTAIVSVALGVFVGLAQAARTITVTNNCPFTIWPAVYTGSGDGPSTGWEAASQASRQLLVPDNWTAGRIWGRRDCDFSKPSTQDCVLGACIGGLNCTQPGIPPVTLAEFSLRQAGGNDFYDVSLVDGFGLPVRLTPSASACNVSECTVDLAPLCPTPLQGAINANGTSLGCKTACGANLDGDQSNSPNCCSGQYVQPGSCPSSRIQYYDFFKSNCPRSYVYAYDESSGTALFTCGQDQNSDYTVTFCP